jgi:hypothetical protein
MSSSWAVILVEIAEVSRSDFGRISKKRYITPLQFVIALDHSTLVSPRPLMKLKYLQGSRDE